MSGTQRSAAQVRGYDSTGEAEGMAGNRSPQRLAPWLLGWTSPPPPVLLQSINES